MNGEKHIWLLFTILFVPILYAASQYECGPHGRFEYCIDGIPGCVVGCHCHPGYYFDTDSKICEPNMKLNQNFRRQYNQEPTRVQVTPGRSVPDEPTTTPNAVDAKLDEITKDADDLGDWLYNQFFKTIENQVINKTQGEELPTRRSGNVLLKKPVRRSHRYLKGKKKKKKKGLRRKLLRITENDSIFESESGSDEDDTSSSSESDTSESEKTDYKKDKSDHGHKKILIYNKKPQPPLPSFIFLPNMDTPYYPPIGLPPPPVMPMYPMVPVPPMVPGPPMGGPLFPYPGVPHRCEENESSTIISTTLLATTNTEPIMTAPPTEPMITTSTTEPIMATSAPLSTDPDNEMPSTDTSNIMRHRKKKNKSGRLSNEKDFSNMMMRGNRNELLKKLQEKLSRKNKLESYIADLYQDTAMDVNDPSEKSNHNLNLNEKAMPPHQGVDFKYLAELIHNADFNKTRNSQIQNNPSNISMDPVIPSRRYYLNDINSNTKTNMIQRRSKLEDPNDSFYASLGKQIASMIRKIDSKGERQVNIEIEGDNIQPKSQTSPIFNENNYASRSFWERSVRSPLKYINSFKKEMEHLRNSNENLFSLENQVEIAASTVSTLSLHDLENIIKRVQKMQLKPKRNQPYSVKGDSSASFKLNLLPGNIETVMAISNSEPVQHFINKDSVIDRGRNKSRIQSDTNKNLLSNYRRLYPDYHDKITTTPTEKNMYRNIALKTNFIPTYLKGPNTNRANPKYQSSPLLLNHKNLNHHTHSEDQFLFPKTQSIQFTGLAKNPGKIENPSYFHHEFHHFDYFD